MDEEMDEATEGDIEIDLDYEFDVPRYFDFSREESPLEARAVELWFDTAVTYPPSPLISKINTGQDAQLENINSISKIEEVNYTIPISGHLENDKGWTLEGCIPQDAPKGDTKSFVKGPFSRGSTLMKPTASQLAKQNRLREVKNELQKSRVMRSDQSIEEPNDNASQAPKRQRLEGGYLCKVLRGKPQTDLMHKAPTKKNEPADCNARLPRLKLTIPREPVLETAKRATTFRAQRLRSKNAEQLQEEIRPTTSTFKALPLNRKILEAPTLPLPQKSAPRLPVFQEFNLKTSERAIQHSVAASLIADNHIIDSCIQDGVTCSEMPFYELPGFSQLQKNKLGECGNMLPRFKARPLNKKIISSKGDIGVFRSGKREVTKPQEFKFSTNKNCQQTPLTEVFNKLSLACEAQRVTASQKNVQPTLHVAHKGSKENIINPVQ